MGNDMSAILDGFRALLRQLRGDLHCATIHYVHLYLKGIVAWLLDAKNVGPGFYIQQGHPSTFVGLSTDVQRREGNLSPWEGLIGFARRDPDRNMPTRGGHFHRTHSRGRQTEPDHGHPELRMLKMNRVGSRRDVLDHEVTVGSGASTDPQSSDSELGVVYRLATHTVNDRAYHDDPTRGLSVLHD